MATEQISVLVAAGGAGWEAAALQRLGAAGAGIVLLKRCVDLSDLLATAATGQARAALVSDGLPGLDADSVAQLDRSGLGVVLVAAPASLADGAEARFRRMGVQHVLDSGSLAALAETVAAAGAGPRPAPQPDRLPAAAGAPVAASPGAEGAGATPGPGRVLVVWGPTGAPGRTTVAVGIAAELAERACESLLLDADGFGGAVAQHLGILDEISGLLAASRMANAGRLDGARLAGLARAVNPMLRVLTGLPRADRWSEVREPAFEQLLELSRTLARYVVVDTAFSLEEDAAAAFGGGPPQRHAMTLAALERADEVVVVGSADPVGLARLARGLVELREVVPDGRLRVVVNRCRPSLGWGEREVRTMIEGFVVPESLHFLPEDRAAADRALVAGRSLVELGDSPLRRGVRELVDAVTGAAAAPRPSRRGLGWSRRSVRRRRSRPRH